MEPGQLSTLWGHAWAMEPHGVNSNIGTKIFAFSLNDSAFLFYVFIWCVHVYVFLKVSHFFFFLLKIISLILISTMYIFILCI